MRVVVFGAGYVGLVQAAGLTSIGNSVLLIESNQQKIHSISQGTSPIHEPGLDDLLSKAIRSELLQIIHLNDPRVRSEINAADVVFIAVGTPEDSAGRADLTALLGVSQLIGETYRGTTPLIVCIKSTVPVGTGDTIEKLILKTGALATVVSNPEFLKQGHAVQDFLRPERIVIGTQDPTAAKVLSALYKPLMLKRERIVLMSRRSAEITKYACNAFLATKISFINEMAQLAEKVGANIHEVREGMITDSRIGEQFLYPGVGYGGSCLPKDTHALCESAKDFGVDLKIIKAVDQVNREQKKWALKKLRDQLGNLSNKRIAVWGLAFKANTDDLRESPAIDIINALTSEGSKVVGHDGLAEKNATVVFKEKIAEGSLEFVNKPADAAKGADALLVLTESSIYRSPDWNEIKGLMGRSLVLDGRNIYDPSVLRLAGFTYLGVGVP